MKLVPLADRVVLKQLVAEETTKSGIVQAGDQVIYSKYAGTDVKIDEEEFIIVKQSDILAVIQ